MLIKSVLKDLVQSGEIDPSIVQQQLRLHIDGNQNENIQNEDDHDISAIVNETNADIAQEWLDKLLENANEFEYLEGKTQEMFQTDIDNLLYSNYGEFYYERYRTKLNTYRWVDNICDLRIGSTYRWLKKEPPIRISAPGKLMAVVFTEHHTIIRAMVFFGKKMKVICYSMNNYYMFQHMSAEESMILYANQLSSTS